MAQYHSIVRLFMFQEASKMKSSDGQESGSGSPENNNGDEVRAYLFYQFVLLEYVSFKHYDVATGNSEKILVD